MHNANILNPEQNEAATHIEGPLLVLAGAGSGKTRVVTYRIAHLLEIGVPATDILALTFTNKAASEMRSRVQELTHQYVLTTTFHSLGARILREAIHLIGYDPNFTIYDAQDSDQLLRDCIKSIGKKDDKTLFKTIRNLISEAKNDLFTPQDFSQDDAFFYDVYTLYQSKLKEYGALDFDDLLLLTVKLLQQSDSARETYQKRWSFLLIDEYQDTNQAQYMMAKLIAGSRQNLFVVGDPDQSIYSWRGANIQNILNFEKDFPGAKVVALEQNYRSTNQILQAANALIESNSSRYKKNLWSALGDGERVEIHQFENERAEANFVVTNLMRYHEKEQIPLDEIVIFYRTNAQSRVFEDALLRENLPYEIIGGLSFYQRREIKDILAFLRLIITPTDFIAFSRVINLPKRGIGPSTLNKLREAAELHSLPIITICKGLASNTSLKLSNKQLLAVGEFVNLLEALEESKEKGKSVHELIYETIELSKYFDYLREDKETFEDRKANLSELIAKAIEWEKDHEHPSLEAFLEDLSLSSSLEDSSQYTGSIKLMTLHNSKGLEFILCYLVGMEEDLFPHMNAKDTPENIEEERRLCYVGMTRAKKHLHLSSSKYRFLWGAPRFMSPSRFLQEIPAEFCIRKEKIQQDFPETEQNDEPTLSPGKIVTHKDFGKGVIKKCYGGSLGLTLDVQFFSDNVTRTLVAKYAKLSLC